MLGRILLGSTLVLGLASPSLAGPCTQRIADLGKAITAQHEGAGPALAKPETTGSTGQASSGAAAPAQAARDNQAMQLLQQAKELDQQGKEDECMGVVARVEAMSPPGTR